MSSATFRFSIPATGVGFAPIYLALDEGLFAREGIGVELVMLEGGPACAEALLSAEVDVTCALGPLIRLAMRGDSRPFKAIAGLRKQISFSIVGKPELRSLEDLRGGTIESPRSDWTGGTYIKYVLRQLGFEGKIGLAYNYVTQEQRLQGLLAGEFAAGMLAAEKSLIAREHGFKVLVAFDEVIPDVSSSAVVTTPKVLDEKREGLKKLLAALRRAVAFMQERPAETTAYFARRFSMTERMAELSYRSHASKWGVGLEVAAVQKEIDINRAVYGLPRLAAESLVDLTLLGETLAA